MKRESYVSARVIILAMQGIKIQNEMKFRKNRSGVTMSKLGEVILK